MPFKWNPQESFQTAAEAAEVLCPGLNITLMFGQGDDFDLPEHPVDLNDLPAYQFMAHGGLDFSIMLNIEGTVHDALNSFVQCLGMALAHTRGEALEDNVVVAHGTAVMLVMNMQGKLGDITLDPDCVKLARVMHPVLQTHAAPRMLG